MSCHAGGWNAFLTSFGTADILNPLMTRMLMAGCEKASVPGWPCHPEMEKLREQFAREPDPAKQKQIAESVQVLATQVTTHVVLGQWYTAVAVRNSVSGIPIAPVPVFWNVTKTSSF